MTALWSTVGVLAFLLVLAAFYRVTHLPPTSYTQTPYACTGHPR